MLVHTYTHTTVLWPFLPDYPVSRCQKKTSSGLHGAREDNRGRHTDNPAGCYSIRTIQRPTSFAPYLRCLPFLLQPSQFIMAWNRHQIAGLHVQWCGLMMLVGQQKWHPENVLHYCQRLTSVRRSLVWSSCELQGWLNKGQPSSSCTVNCTVNSAYPRVEILSVNHDRL